MKELLFDPEEGWVGKTGLDALNFGSNLGMRGENGAAENGGNHFVTAEAKDGDVTECAEWLTLICLAEGVGAIFD